MLIHEMYIDSKEEKIIIEMNKDFFMYMKHLIYASNKKVSLDFVY